VAVTVQVGAHSLPQRHQDTKTQSELGKKVLNFVPLCLSGDYPPYSLAAKNLIAGADICGQGRSSPQSNGFGPHPPDVPFGV